MQITRKHKMIASSTVVVVLVIGYIAFDLKSKKAMNDEQLTVTKVATTTGVTYKVENVTNEKVSQVPKPIPDLDRYLVRSSMANPSENDSLIATQKIKEFQALLKKDPMYFPGWMDLAMYQKLGGDYEGALISWKYAGKIAPKDFVSIANIANLYAYFIKDNGMAEEYYKMAIEKAPTESYLYTQLAEVYRDIFKSTAKAKAIVDQGLSKIPNDPTLLEFKDMLK
ncbi:MAG: hypothetical protein WAX85_02700 [Minisyncoccia bacterium]